MIPEEPAAPVDPAATLRDSEARWRAVVESAVDAIILIDRRGVIETFNPAAERLFGYQLSEIVGRNISSLMPAPYSAEHDGYLRRYLQTGERRIIGLGREVKARRKDGSIFPAHLSVAEMVVDGETKFTGIVRDLTDRAILEQQLREATALARLGQFAAVLAHEVRNPLAAVSGAIQVLRDRLALAPDDQRVVAEILQRIDSLSALIGDLLLYARPPRPALAPVTVAHLVESLISFLRADQALANVSFECRGLMAPVSADAEQLRIALQNLLINAAQASPPRGRVLIELSEAGEVGQIDVVDAGAGIPEGVRGALFTPFTTTKPRGTGLGLATVRSIAVAHGGEAAVVETGPSGTRMRLSIPLATEAR